MKSLISIFFVFYYIYAYRHISTFGGNDISRYRRIGIGISGHPSSEFRTPILKILGPPLCPKGVVEGPADGYRRVGGSSSGA